MAEKDKPAPSALPLDAAEFDRQMRKALSKPPMPEAKAKKETARKALKSRPKG